MNNKNTIQQEEKKFISKCINRISTDAVRTFKICADKETIIDHKIYPEQEGSYLCMEFNGMICVMISFKKDMQEYPICTELFDKVQDIRKTYRDRKIVVRINANDQMLCNFINGKPHDICQYVCEYKLKKSEFIAKNDCPFTPRGYEEEHLMAYIGCLNAAFKKQQEILNEEPESITQSEIDE